MKLVYKDLINLLFEKPSKELLSEKLFQLGHEHEIHGDIFDMELTPNRGDCLSLTGLARDLNIFFGKADFHSVYKDEIDLLDIDFENLSPIDRSQISFLEIEIEGPVASYKPYLEDYFNFIGNKKTNLFSDVSNYISYELGQPTHCFDRELINGKLCFENKKCNEIFETLLGSKIKLKDYNCVFSMNNEVISLAGVMGGASTACSTKTNKVLVECAYFNPESIIGKSIGYNLNSDSAHKFERGVDIGSQQTTLKRFAKIIQDHAKIKSIKLKSFLSNDYQHCYLPIEIKKINKILGTSIDESQYTNILTKLGFSIGNKIKVPSFRHDIKSNNDLAEEVARAVGYNNIISKPINLKKIDNTNKNNIDKIETLLINNGFSEVINYPFSSMNKKNSINIDNPLDKTRKSFRTSLKESLVENLLYNERRQKDSIKLFEISDIYTLDLAIEQKKKLGIIISGRLGNNHNNFSKKLDYKFFSQLLGSNLSKHITEVARADLDTKKKDKIFYVEMFIDDIPNVFFKNIDTLNKTIDFIKYKPVSEFPSSIRDFSFSITNLLNVSKVIKALDEISDDLIKESFVFDFYKDNKIGAVKLGYRFIFQSHLKTLSDEEINTKALAMIEPILKLDGVYIPGM
jgi:phenylalanyl-tRNA synthetase beta chain